MLCNSHVEYIYTNTCNQVAFANKSSIYPCKITLDQNHVTKTYTHDNHSNEKIFHFIPVIKKTCTFINSVDINKKMVEPWGFILLWKTTIVDVHFAHASPWLSTIPITKPSCISCTFFSNLGQGLKLLVYHPKNIFELKIAKITIVN